MLRSGSMRKLTLILALVSLMACNRDRVAANDTAAQSGANDNVVPTDSMTSGAETGTALVPVGGTDTSATTVTSSTPGGTTTTRAITNEPPPDTAPAPAERISQGQGVYRERCASCHGADGKKATGAVTLASAATQARPDAELARAIRENPAHKQLTVEQEQVSAVIAYVKALQ